MTTTARRATLNRSPRRGLATVLRSMLALLLLAALLVGIPAVLLVVTDGMPAAPISSVQDLLRADDGTMLRAVLVWVAWLGWASFAVSVVVEAGSWVLRRPAPRIRGLECSSAPPPCWSLPSRCCSPHPPPAVAASGQTAPPRVAPSHGRDGDPRDTGVATTALAARASAHPRNRGHAHGDRGGRCARLVGHRGGLPGRRAPLARDLRPQRRRGAAGRVGLVGLGLDRTRLGAHPARRRVTAG